MDFSTLLKKSVWALMVRVVGAISAFVMSAVVAKSLSADDAGIFFLGFSIAFFASVLSRLGFDNYAIKSVAVASSKGDSWGAYYVAKVMLVITLFVSFIVASLLWMCSDFLAREIFSKPDLSIALKSFSLGIVGLSMLTVLAMALQAKEMPMSSILVLNILPNILFSFLVYILDVRSASVAAAVYSSLLVIAALVALVLYLKTLDLTSDSHRYGENVIHWRVIVASCMPLWVELIFSQIIQWSGQIVAGLHYSSSDIALFALSQRLAMLISFILLAFNLVVAPRFAALHSAGSKENIKYVCITSIRIMALFASPLYLIMMLFPESLLSIFGPEYVGANDLLRVMATAQFFNVSTGAVGYLLMMTDNGRDLRNIQIFVALMLLVFFAFYGGEIGVIGVGLAVATAIFVQNLLAALAVRNRLKINVFSAFCFKVISSGR